MIALMTFPLKEHLNLSLTRSLSQRSNRLWGFSWTFWSQRLRVRNTMIWNIAWHMSLCFRTCWI